MTEEDKKYFDEKFSNIANGILALALMVGVIAIIWALLIVSTAHAAEPSVIIEFTSAQELQHKVDSVINRFEIDTVYYDLTNIITGQSDSEWTELHPVFRELVSLVVVRHYEIFTYQNPIWDEERFGIDTIETKGQALLTWRTK